MCAFAVDQHDEAQMVDSQNRQESLCASAPAAPNVTILPPRLSCLYPSCSCTQVCRKDKKTDDGRISRNLIHPNSLPVV